MSDLHEKFHPRNRRWPSGMPQSIAATTYTERELTTVRCPYHNSRNCEFNVRVHRQAATFTLQQHLEKSCPLRAAGTPGFEEAKEAKHNGKHEELIPVVPSASSVRQFETGATRDTDDGKLDYEGFLSPLVLERFAQYMHEHRIQSDGTLRASDNWQKGIPQNEYMKSLWRHHMDVWKMHRHPMLNQDLGRAPDEPLETALCAILFNAMGYLHELLKDR